MNKFFTGQLPEPKAEDILNGTFKHKPSPKVDFYFDAQGFAQDRVCEVPKPYEHPRILFSQEEIPDIRTRIASTKTGRILLENLRRRTYSTIRNENSWEGQVFKLFIECKTVEAEELLKNPFNPVTGHYQPEFFYPLMLDSFDCLIYNDDIQGKKIAVVITEIAKMLEPEIEQLRKGEYGDNAWRSGLKDTMKQMLIGYIYDFVYNFMTKEQQDTVRRLISKATKGSINAGMELPSHFRNWNWIACSNDFLLLALAIEGEEGSDERIYRLASEVLCDYFTYGFTEKGTSTEAVGYTSFGFNWGVPAMIALARRGDNYFIHSHYKKIKEWYLHTMQPYGPKWISSGDGGDGGPGLYVLQPMKYFYPNDMLVDYLWKKTVCGVGSDPREHGIMLIPTILCAEDGMQEEYNIGKEIDISKTYWDKVRGTLITRTSWEKDAVWFGFEGRCDSHSPSHQHADRGMFSLSALGRTWTKESFRAIEGKYHNQVLIDGRGQGYFALPCIWDDMTDSEFCTFASINTTDVYNWFWPKTMVATTDLDDPKLNFKRWAGYRNGIIGFNEVYKNRSKELESAPNVREFYEDYLNGNPRMWDEDGWPVRVEHNNIQYAYRTAGIVKQGIPYCLIIDDVKKDDIERLYEWNMVVCDDLNVVSIEDKDIILGAENIPTQKSNVFFMAPQKKPEIGEPLLLVRIVEMGMPADKADYDVIPNPRLEVFEKKDTANFGGRSFGVNKRLVIGARSASANFKILLYPFKYGDDLPITTLNEDNSMLTVEIGNQKDEYMFDQNSKGKTTFKLLRDGKEKANIK